MNKINFALVGCGRISYKHVEAMMKNNAYVSLTAVCDIDIQKAKDTASTYQKKTEGTDGERKEILIYEDYQEILKNPQIDAIVIATESGKHAKIAIDALQKGKHVLVEKPMALSTKDADQMIALAAEKGLKLCVSHQNRFNPAIQKLKKAVDEGRFGKIYAASARILWNRSEGYYKQAPWRGTFEQDGGCLMNQCIHNIDLLQWMVGQDIEAIHGVVNNYLHPYMEAEDYGNIQLLFTNGTIGSIEGTVNIFPENLEETLSIFGEKGSVVIGGKAVNKVLVWQFSDQKDTIEQIRREYDEEIENVYGNGHTPLYADFIESVRNNKNLLIDGNEGKKAMAIILHGYLSNMRKERVLFGEMDIEINKNGINTIG